MEVGILELNANPRNYFAEVEQAAFSPSNLPPGIGASPDKMLQARLFAYPDAQRYRLGGNYQLLPVNRAKSPVHTYQRDGAMRFDENGAHDNYEPNGFGGPVQDESRMEPPLSLAGAATHYDQHKGNDDYSQAGDLYRLLKEDERDRLTSVIAGTMKGVPEAVLVPNLRHFYKCDAEYGSEIAKKVGIDPTKIK
jgi:catalase